MARPPNSWVWEHFRQDTSKDPSPAYTSVSCQICNKTLRYSSRNGPTNLSRHLTRSHHMHPPDSNITRRPFEPITIKPIESGSETKELTSHEFETNANSTYNMNPNNSSIEVNNNLSNVSSINSNKINGNDTTNSITKNDNNSSINNNNDNINNNSNGTISVNNKDNNTNSLNNSKTNTTNTILNDRILNNPINTLIPNFSPARFSQYKQNSDELLFQTPSRTNIRRVRSHSRSLSSDMFLPQSSYLPANEMNLNPLFPESIKSSNRSEYDQFLKNVNLLPIYRMDVGKKNADSTLSGRKDSKHSQNLKSNSNEKKVSPLLPSQRFSSEIKIGKQLGDQQSQLLSTNLVSTHLDAPPKPYYAINNQYNNEQQQQQQQQKYRNTDTKSLNIDEKENQIRLQHPDSNRAVTNSNHVIGLTLPNISDIGDFNSIPNVLSGVTLINEQINAQKHNNKRIKIGNIDNGSQTSNIMIMQNISNSDSNINNDGGFPSPLQTIPENNRNSKLSLQSQPHSQSQIPRQQNQQQLEQMEHLNQLDQFNQIQQLEHIQQLENIPGLDHIEMNRIASLAGTGSVLTGNAKIQTPEQFMIPKLLDIIQTLQYSVANFEKELKLQKDAVIKVEQKLARNVNERRGSGLEISYDILPWKPENSNNGDNDTNDIQLPLITNVFIIFSLTSEQLNRYLHVYNLSKITDNSDILVNNNQKDKEHENKDKNSRDVKLKTNTKEGNLDMNFDKENIFQLAKFIGCLDVEKYWEVFSCSR